MPGQNRRGSKTVLAALSLGVLIAQIDTSVVNLAVHPIGTYFSADMAELQWSVDSYNLVYAILLLTGGLLADLYGRKRMFLIGVAIFTVASLLCTFAPSISALIAGRAFAGLGAALLIPSSMAIIRVEWPEQTERARVLGIWASCYGLALAIGPTIGGTMIENCGWRSIFLIAVPLGAAVIALASGSIRESSDPLDRHFDFPAQILGAAAIGGLAFAAIAARDSVAQSLICITVAITSMTLFVMVESHKGNVALVPLGIFRIKEFRGAVAGAASMTFSMYGLLFSLPLAWQESGKLSAAGAGLALVPMALIYVSTSSISGRLSARFGARFMCCIGLATIGIGLLFLGVSSMSVWMDEIGLIMDGLGMGFATGPLIGLAVGAVPAARSGTASSIYNVARMIGATLGVAVLGAAYSAVHDRTIGLSISMFLGGSVQFAGAFLTWRGMRSG